MSDLIKHLANELKQLRAEVERLQKYKKEYFGSGEYLNEVLADRDQLREENARLRAVADAARLASQEIQAQRTMWPGEVDTLADALAALDAWERDGEGK